MNDRDAQIVRMLRRGNGVKQLASMFAMPVAEIAELKKKHVRRRRKPQTDAEIAERIECISRPYP